MFKLSNKKQSSALALSLAPKAPVAPFPAPPRPMGWFLVRPVDYGRYAEFTRDAYATGL